MISGGPSRILTCFTSQDTHTFVELCKLAGYPTDLGGYYIRQLISGGYLAKSDRGKYTLTIQGKRALATAFGTHSRLSRPRLIALIVAKQGNAYILMRRTVQPFINRIEWPGGAVNGGETLQEAASRITKERIGVPDQHPSLLGFFRRLDTYKDSLFDDKLFAVHTLTLLEKAKVTTSNEKGEVVLHKEAEIQDTEVPSRALFDILDYVRTRQGNFEEHVYDLGKSDLTPNGDPEI